MMVTPSQVGGAGEDYRTAHVEARVKQPSPPSPDPSPALEMERDGEMEMR